jgi:hypothetical protein
VVVFLIIMGVNRDELISRISNATPNQLSFDGDLFSNRFT